ncbi:MAG: hypothetical protein WA610_09260, partial [Thermodesulfovibrionales bacterium]
TALVSLSIYNPFEFFTFYPDRNSIFQMKFKTFLRAARRIGTPEKKYYPQFNIIFDALAGC